MVSVLSRFLQTQKLITLFEMLRNTKLNSRTVYLSKSNTSGVTVIGVIVEVDTVIAVVIILKVDLK